MNGRSRCAACKYLRRRCPDDCIFADYFPPNDIQRFATVHRIYGASNAAKMLQELPPGMRAQAADSMCFEAQCRVQDPVYGCVGIISTLLNQIQETRDEIIQTRAEITVLSSDLHTSQHYRNSQGAMPSWDASHLSGN